MSWNVAVVGRPSKVAERLKLDFEKMTYLKNSPPEHEIAEAIGQALIKAAQDTSPLAVIRVEAQAIMTGIGAHDHTHEITVKVTPLYGFVG